ncbi:MAG: type II toxin-antitoxin system ParD family antitoxin [Balneolaceae bacterium]|nr:type II toxin-antitoxin system ParD family antitoxin [Balneolaceae bacterium]
MSKNTSITLSDHFQDFIKKEVSSGRYTNASEVIRTALRLLQNEEQKMQNLRNALEKGEESDLREDFDPKKHLKSLHEKHL